MILAIETSGPLCSIGLLDEDTEFRAKTNARFQHAETLNALIDFMQEVLPLSRVRSVVISTGPGYFTSLRAGAAAAKALWLALGVDLFGVNTLFALSQDAQEYPVACALDAKKGQVYGAIYRKDKALLEPGIYAWPEFVEKTREIQVRGFAGAAALEHAAGNMIGPAEPDPITLARLLQEGKAERLDPEAFEPLYLREPDAVVNLNK